MGKTLKKALNAIKYEVNYYFFFHQMAAVLPRYMIYSYTGFIEAIKRGKKIIMI